MSIESSEGVLLIRRLLRTGSPTLSVLRREEAQTMAEYALILSLVTLVALAGLTLAAGRIVGLYDAITTAWP